MSEAPAYQNTEDLSKIERFLKLIDECRGNLSAIAREEGVTRQRIKDYIDSKPELVNAVHDWRQGIIDKAEDNIFMDVEKGDSAASRLVAQTLGKDRGWVPREEKTGADGAPLVPPTITFALDEPKENPDE